MRRSSPPVGVLVLVPVLVIGMVCARAASAQSGQGKSPCDRLLSPKEIAEATGLAVGKGERGPNFAGAQDSCVWQGSDGTKIIVMLTAATPMETTMSSMAQTGGTLYDGLGTIAVGTRGIPETGGGYNLSFLDAKGGVAVTIPGSAGTGDRTVALGKLIAKRRSGSAEQNQQGALSPRADRPGQWQQRVLTFAHGDDDRRPAMLE